MTNHNSPFPWSTHSVLQAWEQIKNAHRITLLTHFKPDGDGMSACAAFESFIKTYDASKIITTIYPTQPEDSVKHAPSTILINTHSQNPDLLIAFDTANYNRLYFPPSFANLPLIVIDHHMNNELKGIYSFVDASITSTCELLYLLMKEWAPSCITHVAAEAIMFGILCDTLTFSIQNIKSQTLRVAAELIEKGVSLYEIKQHAFTPKSPNTIKAWGEFMKSMFFSNNNKAGWIIFSQDDLQKAHCTTRDINGFNNFIAGLSSCDVVIIGYEMEDKRIKLSFRSKTTNVNELAKQFGGGGHKFASGALCNEPLSVLREKIKALCETL